MGELGALVGHMDRLPLMILQINRLVNLMANPIRDVMGSVSSIVARWGRRLKRGKRGGPMNAKARKEQLLGDIKANSKKIFEEYVVLNCIREDSQSVVQLCVSIEAVFDDGLKRKYCGRQVDLVRNDSILFDRIEEILSRRQFRRQNLKIWWISVAISNRMLAEIFRHLMRNSRKFYHEDAFLRDPEFCEIFLSLMDGPCSLHYSRSSTCLHLQSDPHADEVVGRYQAASIPISLPPDPRRPGGFLIQRNPPTDWVSDCIEGMHRTHRVRLIFAKNHVHLKNNSEAGYFSVCQSEGEVFLRWAANQTPCDENGVLVASCFSKVPLRSLRNIFYLRKGDKGFVLCQGACSQIVMKLKFPNWENAEDAIRSLRTASGTPHSLISRRYFSGFQKLTVVSTASSFPRSIAVSGEADTRHVVHDACERIRGRILMRFFEEWKHHVKLVVKIKEIRPELVRPNAVLTPTAERLTKSLWKKFAEGAQPIDPHEVCRRIYFNSMDDSVRPEVWPFLLGHYSWSHSLRQRRKVDGACEEDYGRKLGICFTAIASWKEGLRDRGSGDLGEAPKRRMGPFLKRKSLSCLEEPLPCEYRRFSHTEKISTDLSERFMKSVALNASKIQKDTIRCDRTYMKGGSLFFDDGNVKKLEDILLVYTIDKLDIGYVQGMCDLLAPFLVVLSNEILAYRCFSLLMGQKGRSFPLGHTMENNFKFLAVVTQIVDRELYDYITGLNDGSEFYFCYRWFLLDFKREFTYQDTFKAWEVIWSAKHVCSDYFVVFIASALLQMHRNVILHYKMGFADIIKFFNERAEKHNLEHVLDRARRLAVYMHNYLYEDR